MFDIGGPELLLILVIALVVMGPRRLPEVGRQIGRAIGALRRASREMRTNLEREVALEEFRKDAGAVRSTVEREVRDVTADPGSEKGAVEGGPRTAAPDAGPAPGAEPSPGAAAKPEAAQDGPSAGELPAADQKGP